MLVAKRTSSVAVHSAHKHIPTKSGRNLEFHLLSTTHTHTANVRTTNTIHFHSGKSAGYHHQPFHSDVVYISITSVAFFFFSFDESKSRVAKNREKKNKNEREKESEMRLEWSKNGRDEPSAVRWRTTINVTAKPSSIHQLTQCDRSRPSTRSKQNKTMKKMLMLTGFSQGLVSEAPSNIDIVAAS